MVEALELCACAADRNTADRILHVMQSRLQEQDELCERLEAASDVNT
jgi:hypothetical protein